MNDIKFTLVDNMHGFDDCDVRGIAHVHRICVPHSIRQGEWFNVYCYDGRKVGARWLGSFQKSMSAFTETQDYKDLSARVP